METTVEPAVPSHAGASSPARARDVLVRMARWLAREGVAERARYVEASLVPWITALDTDASAFLALVTGFDALDADARRALAPALVAAAEALEAQAVVVVAEPRAVLLPAGHPEHVRRVTVAVADPATDVGGGDEAPSRVEPAQAAAASESGVQEGGRGDRGGRRDRRDRHDRERQERRDGRNQRGDRTEAAAEVAAESRQPERVAEAPRVEKPVEPPRPPEPRTFPLAHPEATGQPVASLGVLDDELCEALASQGVTTIADLFLVPPVSVERAGERWTPTSTVGSTVVVRGKVTRRCVRFRPGVRREELVLVTDREAHVACRWYGEVAPEIAALRPGAEVGLAGLLEHEDDAHVLLQAEVLGLDGRGGDWLARYDLPGIPDARLRSALRAAIRTHLESLTDHLPPEMLEKHRLLPLGAALRDAHFPSNASRKGRSRLGFDELLQVQLGVALLRARERRERGVATPITHSPLTRAQGMLGWQFTDAQETVFDDIRRDLRRAQPMARLLQGDVGVGKHAVVQAAMLVVAEGKHQAVFIAPDAVAAEHRFLFAEGFFRSVGIEPMLLVGAPNRAQAESLRKGDALVVYATPALLKEVPAFRKLGLVVVEEHGPYGVTDVAAFDANGQRPDLLVFTPTPVPSAIALNLYGALSLTVMPPAGGRGVDTVALDAARREEAYSAAREAIEAGQQVILAFPLVRGQDLLSPSEARRLAEVLATETFPGAKIGIFSGGMTREERFRAYDDFQHQRTQVLLATTYVEHGPTVPNATVMLVEYAERFDLVRLHRLRGHVAGGWRRGKCMLVTADESVSTDARHHLELLLQETDGFRIAELDVRHRGLEAVLGERAGEAPDFAWADPVQERDLLVKTRQEAIRLLVQDPGLKRRTNRALLHLVRARFGEDVGAEGVGGGEGTPAAAGSTAAAANSKDGAARKRRRRRGR